MSSYSCVTARLTMRSVLHTQGDSRSRSGPVIGLLPRPPMAPMLPAMSSPRKFFIFIYIYTPCGEAVGFESSWRWPMSQEAEGAGQTTQGDAYVTGTELFWAEPIARFGMALASSTGETSRDLARMETMMQEDEHHGDRWFKEAVQQAKVAETIQAMKAETRAQGTPLGGTGRFTHGARTPDDEGELRYAVTASGGKVILAFGTPVEWIGMTPRMAHQLADALNKWAGETRSLPRAGGESDR